MYEIKNPQMHRDRENGYLIISCKCQNNSSMFMNSITKLKQSILKYGFVKQNNAENTK